MPASPERRFPFPVDAYFFDRPAGLNGIDPNERVHEAGVVQLREYVQATVEPNLGLELSGNDELWQMGGLTDREIRFLRPKLVELDQMRTEHGPRLRALRRQTPYESSNSPNHRELRRLEQFILSEIVDLIHLPSAQSPLDRALNELELEPQRLVTACLDRGAIDVTPTQELRHLPKEPRLVIDRRIGRLTILLEHWLPPRIAGFPGEEQPAARETFVVAGTDLAERYFLLSGLPDLRPTLENAGTGLLEAAVRGRRRRGPPLPHRAPERRHELDADRHARSPHDGRPLDESPLMEITDTHCHFNDPNFPVSTDEVIVNATKVGVTQFVVPGMDLPTSERILEQLRSGQSVPLFLRKD